MEEMAREMARRTRSRYRGDPISWLLMLAKEVQASGDNPRMRPPIELRDALEAGIASGDARAVDLAALFITEERMRRLRERDPRG